MPLAVLLTNAETVDPAAQQALAGLLTAFDPFRIWFWLVVIIGLSATTQLRGWRAWTVCSLCWLIAAGMRTGLAVALASAT